MPPIGPQGQRRSPNPTTSAVQVARIAVGLDEEERVGPKTEEEEKDREVFRDNLARAAEEIWGN